MNPQAGFAPHVTLLGQGPRRALALHCTMAFGGAWAGIAKVLGDQVTLIAPDMPSHGKSADWDEVSDFSDTVFAASLSAMDEAPMDIIGHSFGAATALRIAVAHPERVRSLTLFEPVFFAVALADAPKSMDPLDDRTDLVLSAIKEGDRSGAARTFNRMWSDSAVWNTLPERTRAAMARAIHVVPGTHRFLYDDASGMLDPGVLSALEIPAVLMRGADTLPAVVATNVGLARRMGNASEAVIPNAGHMAPITHPVEVAREIAELLARC